MATTPPNYGPIPGPQPTVPPPPAPPVYGPPSPAPAPATPTVTTPTGTTDPGMLGDWYAQYKGPGATTDWKVDKNQTVQGQVADITKADGVLMQQASTRAAQQSSGRGLLNSSLGVQAGQAALYDAAMPMAQQDAGTYADAAKTNAGAKNDLNLGMFNNATDIYRDRARDEFTAGQNTLDREFRTGERIAGQEFTAGENTLNREFDNANREDTQSFEAGQSALDKAFTTGERVSSQDFTSVQAALDREQEAKIRTLMEGGMDKRQATDIASAERMQKAGQVFTAEQATLDRTQADKTREDTQAFEKGEAALDRSFKTGERVSSQDFSSAQAVLDRDQQTRIAELQDQGMDRRQAETIAASEREQKAGQVFTAEQAALDRTLTTGQAALDRAFKTGERVDSQNFTAAQATLDRDQQNKIQTLQEEGMTDRQATDIAARERMQKAQQTFDSTTLAKEQEFTVTQSSTNFERQLELMDKSAGTSLAADYRTESGRALTAYQAGVTDIQQSDMDEDVKVAQIAALGTIYQTTMEFNNTLFENSPGWSDEWSTVSPEFDEEGA